ncbi:hypothetical protein G5I_08015 [Acromyrmex echinatior]|uniref:Uncharacterized protein n=1 Tax=Acromyrmex echinatior TaxID=103372 RepID=F4WQC9_ACREC|nr:hypothetical protein G5I_08015 [Acromyrmex echinatior]
MKATAVTRAPLILDVRLRDTFPRQEPEDVTRTERDDDTPERAIIDEGESGSKDQQCSRAKQSAKRIESRYDMIGKATLRSKDGESPG